MSQYDISVLELNASCQQLAQPSNTEIKLKPHQLTLLKRCLEFELDKVPIKRTQNSDDEMPVEYLKTRIGIIGDKVGSGKSFVILSLITHHKFDPSETTMFSFGFNNISMCLKDEMAHCHTNLLVIPHNICLQWEDYIKRFGDKNLRYAIINKTKQLGLLDNIDAFDLLVVTASFFQRVAVVIEQKRVRLQRIIFDEADSISTNTFISLPCHFVWFVTASYGNLIYPRGLCVWDHSIQKYVSNATGLRSPSYIRNLFYDLSGNMPKEYIKCIIVKNEDKFVDESMILPQSIDHVIKCKTPSVIRILHGIVDKNIIERLNANDVVGAIELVDHGHKKTQDTIILSLIEKYQRQLTNIELRIKMAQQYNYENEDDRAGELSRQNNKHAEITNKIDCIKERIQQSETCCICYDNIHNKTVVTCCSNPFCFKCINIWMNTRNNCPICKATINMKNLLVVTDSQKEEPDKLTCEEYDKITNFSQIIQDLSSQKDGIKHKVLVFSNYENTFINVVDTLKQLKAPFDYLKGNANKIRCTLDKYRDGDLDILLVNTNNYGSGLNLENTTDMILFHKFEDNEIEKQVIGRAQRFGRQYPLHIWHLLHENEMC